MAEIQIYFIGTSKIKEIRVGGSVTFDWGKCGKWTTFKKPVKKSSKKVKYNRKKKNTPGSPKFKKENGVPVGGIEVPVGGITLLGSKLPHTEIRTIEGVSRVCEVRYNVRGYTRYKRTASLKKKKKMRKYTYTKSSPYQYQLQYKDKPVSNAEYSKYENGMDYIYFSDTYYDDEGRALPTRGHMQHPKKCDFKYSDVRRNFDTASANNTDGRDNTGIFVLSNVRSNVVTLSLEWEGLIAEEGRDLLDTLNPTKDEDGEYNYLTVQYLDPASNKVVNGTFYASDRDVQKYSNGNFKNIKVTLTEV